MRWLSFFILAYLALGLQLGVARAVEFHGAQPNFVLLALVFIAINAPRDAALLGAFILGALQDVTTQGTMGLYSFSYGCAGLFIFWAQSAVYRRHPLTHMVLALVAGCVVALMIVLHNWLRVPAMDRPAGMPFFFSAVYTAVLAPFFVGGLQAIKTLFGFHDARTSRAALSMRRS